MIYTFLEKVLPFSYMNYEFMKNAFLAIILISPLFALLGTMVVNKKMAFFSDALGHSALCGIAIRNFFRYFEFKYFYDTICSYFCNSFKYNKE